MPFLSSELTPKTTLVDEARAILDRQETETWQWRDADLRSFLEGGIFALERIRPAAGDVGVRRVPREMVEIPKKPDDESDPDEMQAYIDDIDALLAKPVLVDGRWHQALIEYICYEAFRRDESDAASQRLAQQHYQSFVELSQR